MPYMLRDFTYVRFIRLVHNWLIDETGPLRGGSDDTHLQIDRCPLQWSSFSSTDGMKSGECKDAALRIG